MQQYTGRLEYQYKKLKVAFPERYGDAQLKERLIFGMKAGLLNATRYVYKQPEATYEMLLKAAKEAELEFTESKNVTARVKAVGVVEKSKNPKLQELNNSLDNIAATLKANNVKGLNQKNTSPTHHRNKPGNLKLEMEGQSYLDLNKFGLVDILCNVTKVACGVMDGKTVHPKKI